MLLSIYVNVKSQTCPTLVKIMYGNIISHTTDTLTKTGESQCTEITPDLFLVHFQCYNAGSAGRKTGEVQNLRPKGMF